MKMKFPFSSKYLPSPTLYQLHADYQFTPSPLFYKEVEIRIKLKCYSKAGAFFRL